MSKHLECFLNHQRPSSELWFSLMDVNSHQSPVDLGNSLALIAGMEWAFKEAENNDDFSLINFFPELIARILDTCSINIALTDDRLSFTTMTHGFPGVSYDFVIDVQGRQTEVIVNSGTVTLFFKNNAVFSGNLNLPNGHSFSTDGESSVQEIRYRHSGEAVVETTTINNRNSFVKEGHCFKANFDIFAEGPIRGTMTYVEEENENSKTFTSVRIDGDSMVIEHIHDGEMTERVITLTDCK